MRKLVLLTLLIAASHVAVSAQETTGTITGSATDQTGGALPGVTVTVKNSNAGVTRTIVTNEAGLYTATLLPVGNYEVAFELQGFQTVTVRGITLHENQAEVDATLESLERVGIDLDTIAEQWQAEWVAADAMSLNNALTTLDRRCSAGNRS